MGPARQLKSPSMLQENISQPQKPQCDSLATSTTSGAAPEPLIESAVQTGIKIQRVSHFTDRRGKGGMKSRMGGALAGWHSPIGENS